MGKRAATKGAPRSPAKKSKADPAFTSVTDAVISTETCPERVRTMLSEMLPFSLKYASDERHELQAMVVGMVEQTLNNEKAALETKARGEAGALNSLKASESTLGDNVTQAETALANAKDTVAAKSAALVDATAAEKASAEHLAKTRSEDKEATEKAAQVVANKIAIEGAVAEHLQPIENGEGGKQHFKKFEPFLKQIELESTLLTALPSTCGKAKDKRGSFDVLVLEEFNKALKAKISALGEDIAGEGPAAAQRLAAVSAAEQDHQAKKTAMEQATEASNAAQKEQADRETALVDAKQAVEDFVPKLEACTKALADAEAALEAFKEGPLVHFTTLQNRVAAVPEEPAEEAPAEEAPAEVATAEA